MLLHLENTPEQCEQRWGLMESGWKGRYGSVSSAKSFLQASKFFVILPSVKGEENGTQHTAPRNSTRQRSVFRKWLVYCDMPGSVSQEWTKPLMSGTWIPHLIVQSRQDSAMINGVEYSTEVQENEKHQVIIICSAQDMIRARSTQTVSYTHLRAHETS